MALRRFLTAAAVTLGALALTPAPASAHPEHGAFAQWRGPSDAQPVSGDEVHITARLAFGEDGVQSWAVEVVAPPEAADAYPGYGTICQQTTGGSPPLATEVDCIWNTTAYPADGALAHNGTYLIRITARNGERRVFSPEPETHTSERLVRVVNQTAAPADVKLSFAEGAKQATLRWSPNPEPDVSRYVVQERIGSADWQTVGETGRKVTTFTRRLATPGTYRYQVAALRSTGEGNQTVASPWATPAGEPKQVVVAEPPKPSTTSSSSTTTTTGASKKAADSDGQGDGQAAPGSPQTEKAESPSGVPAPVSTGGSVDPAAGAVDPTPGEAKPAAPSSPPARSSFTPIAPGGPGSVESRQSFSGNVTEKPAAPKAAAKAAQPRVVQEPDGPYSPTLPYPKAAPPADTSADDDGAELETVEPGDEEAAIGLPASRSQSDPRAVAVPLAGGLLLFVFAMLALHVSRRSSEMALETD